MLESEIKGLKEEVALLRETIRVLIYAMGHNGQAPAMPIEPVKAEWPNAEDKDAPAFPAPDAPEQNESEEAVTADAVQTLCMTIVRKDRAKKAKVKEAIAEFGASLVKDVAVDKLPELKARLEAI
ncbi:MAG: hypothetical protein IBX55_17065 [Methyloprofundus sp.]|nr:hypothetical protein [Methyloprofundus sp.]